MIPTNTPTKKLFLIIFSVLCFAACKKETPKSISNAPPTTNNVINIASSRTLESGTLIYQSAYIDQPYILKLKNGNWFCVYTKSPLKEGSAGETIGISISSDEGVTWKYTGDLEPSSGPDAYYAIPFLSQNGRIYVIYGYNIDNTNDGVRFDMVGKMCYKYSDDNGQTWSDRFIIDIPITYLDLNNRFHDNGVHQSWWSICKPILAADGQMYFGFTKTGFTDTHDGYIVNSPNINTEQDNSKLIWNFYPNAQHGILSPLMGPVQEEHNIVQMSNGKFVCILRTALGYPGICYSSDNCHTWTVPLPITYPDGDTVRNPRACPRIFKCLNGNYILWFHNDSHINGYRNPVWVIGGVEQNGAIKWSQPEILLYSPSLANSLLISYPDLIEADGQYLITETQKKIARIHKITPDLLNALWSQGTLSNALTGNLAATFNNQLNTSAVQNVVLNSTTAWQGVSLEMKLNTALLKPNTTLVTISKGSSTLIKLVTRASGAIGADMYSSTGTVVLSYDFDTTFLTKNGKNIVSVMLDNQARVISSMINGKFSNRSNDPFQGWSRLPATFAFTTLDGIAVSSNAITNARIFNTGLRTSDMLSEYNYFLNN